MHEAQIIDCQTVNKTLHAYIQPECHFGSEIHHVQWKTKAQLSLENYNFLWGPKTFGVLQPLCVYVFINACQCVCVRITHLSQTSITSGYCPLAVSQASHPLSLCLIAEGCSGYTLC